MESRRTFLKKTAVATVVLSVSAIPACSCSERIRAEVPIRTTETKKALVAWYSQTGYTERDGRLLARTMESHGVNVTSSDVRDVDINRIKDYDLIVVGSPVFYYDTPAYVKDWIMSLPDLEGTPVASYVTFGGPEGNQHNAACSILECLSKKKGAPIALNTFRNMGTFPLSWSNDKDSDNILEDSHLPNEETYKKVRAYAESILSKVKQGKTGEFVKTLNLREVSTLFNPVWWTKLSIENQSIIEDKCIGCGTCVEKCPVNAINLSTYTVNVGSCVLCFGCLNNCPAQAVNMEYKGNRLIGYDELMKMKGFQVTEPEEQKV
jgi:ferredoxin